MCQLNFNEVLHNMRFTINRLIPWILILTTPIIILNNSSKNERNTKILSYEFNYPYDEILKIKHKKFDNEKQDILIEENIMSNIKLNMKRLLKKITYEVEGDRDNYSLNINMNPPEAYSDLKGVTCFRGNPYRDSASYGFARIEKKKLKKIWEISIGGIDRWTGVGWNGQPAIVKWPYSVQKIMNIKEEKKNKRDLVEVVYGALDGKVYFIDINDGEYTREPITLPGPIKGSVTIDPRGIPLLYVGQGINTVNGKRVETGFRIFNLIDQKLLFYINGIDGFAYRGWPAFDSNSIVDKDSDTLFVCGENGIFYKVKLNTKYNIDKRFLNIAPKIEKYRYRIEGNNYQGIENSVAIYKNLAYFADNGGWIQCVDINNMKPIWIRDVTDDTDSTIVLEGNMDRLVLYTSCEVDKQGSIGYSFIRKIDGLSGELLWEKKYNCHSKLGDSPSNGGALATPVVGKYNLDNIIICNLARYNSINKGLLVALDKENGREVWRIELNNYSWSSPVAVYTEDGKGYIIVCDSAGIMYLIEGRQGKILDRIHLGANVEASPAVFENTIVVGTRGQKIFGIEVE